MNGRKHAQSIILFESFKHDLFVKSIIDFNKYILSWKIRNSSQKININNHIVYILSMKQYLAGIVWMRMFLKVHQRRGIRLLKWSCLVIGVVEWLINSPTWHAFLSVSGMLDIHHFFMKHNYLTYYKLWEELRKRQMKSKHSKF